MATMSYDRPQGGGLVHGSAKSTASVVAIAAAIGSFVLSAYGREIFALIVALVAIGAGLLGGLKALSPRVSGGILSIAAVLLGVIAVLVAVIALFV